MKRVSIFLLSIIFLSLASASPSLNPQHDDINKGETYFATITTSGNFTFEISKSNIKFYEGRKEIFLEADIKLYNNAYYLYFYATREGNFRIEISNILYKELDQLKEFDIIQNITILPSLNNSMTIKPGFVFSASIPSIKIINSAESQLSFTYNKTETTLSPAQSHTINPIPKEEFSFIEISSYKDFKVPVIYLSYNDTIPKESEENNTKTNTEASLKITPSRILRNIIINSEAKDVITLFNFGDKNISDIEFSTNIASLKITDLTELAARGVQNLSLEYSPKNPGHIKGQINISYKEGGEEFSLTIPIDLFVLGEGSSEEDFVQSVETCEDKGGDVCTLEQKCEGIPSFTRGGDYCCVGTCVGTTEESSGGYGWLIGLLLFLIIIFAGFYFYKKQKAMKPKKAEEQIKDSGENYSKRIQGSVQRN